MDAGNDIEKAKNVLRLKEKTYLDFDATVDKVALQRHPNQQGLLLTINGREFEVGRVMNAFPLSDYFKRVVFFNTSGEEIGILKKAYNLDQHSRQLLQEELDKAYFMPSIESIRDISDHLGLELWQVITDRGERDFEVRQPRKNVRIISPKRMIVKDVDGNRYEIKDWRMLDKKSLAMLMRHL